MRKKVYIASPYTLGNVEDNVNLQIECANKLMDNGFLPYVPLMAHFHELKFPRPYEFWIEFTLEWMLACDYVLRLPGESKGADQEVKVAEENGIRVFYSIEELFEYEREYIKEYKKKI